MIQNPIIIGGFGRSGTTWLSDIISKILGGLILFEPYHPAVFEKAHEYCYSASSNNLQALVDQWHAWDTKRIENPWIIRNHLKDPLEDCSEGFIQYVWSQSKILGFKTIRSVHLLMHLQKALDARIIYIHRHPLAVVNSINNRSNFWEEFGWEWHLQAFFKRTITTDNFNHEEIRLLQSLVKGVKGRNAAIVLMWSISFIISLRQTKKCFGHIISYEQLYLEPFEEVRKMLDFLGVGEFGIHPSHLFTPSMTTLNTLHHHLGLFNFTRKELDNLFWRSHLDPSEIGSLLSLVLRVLEIDESAYAHAIASKYLVRK